MDDTYIPPSVGRVVWFFPGILEKEEGWNIPPGGAPLAAVIAGVVNMGYVHLSVLDYHGVQHSRQNIRLTSYEDEEDAVTSFACWMPYQIEQAKSKLDKVCKAEAPQFRSDPHLRQKCLELAVSSAGPNSHESDIVRTANAFEKYILKENNNG